MSKQIEVVYEKGVLRPLDPLAVDIPEHQKLIVTIVSITDPEDWLADADPSASLEAVRAALSKAPATMAQMVHAEREER
jgi:predicted DNA-binding antitoxin AbrB/MazE fold protein